MFGMPLEHEGAVSETTGPFLTAASVPSLAGSLSWFALGGLWLTAVLSGRVSLTSGLLAFRCKFEGYNRGDEGLSGVCLVISTGILLFGGIWAAAIKLLG